MTQAPPVRKTHKYQVPPYNNSFATATQHPTFVLSCLHVSGHVGTVLMRSGKGKVHPRTGHEGPEGEQRYNSTLSLTSALNGWVINATLRLLYPRERPGTHCKEAGWASEPVWTGAENLAPTGIRSPERPARSESLYRLSYPGPCFSANFTQKHACVFAFFELIVTGSVSNNICRE